LKSKEPKEAKEKKKSESKPRKSAKAKQATMQAVPEPEVRPTVVAAEWPIEQHTNGAAEAPVAQNDQQVGAASAPVTAMADGPIAAEPNPPEEMIRARAYELFMERGCEHGRQLDDWFAAERELKLKHRAA